MGIRKILRKHETIEELGDEEDTKTGEFGYISKGVYSVGTIATIRVRRIAHIRGVYSGVTIKRKFIGQSQDILRNHYH